MPISTLNPHQNRPLCVDLDGTLLSSDVLRESLWTLWQTRPYQLLHSLLSLLKGKAAFKRKIALLVEFQPQNHHFNLDVIEFLECSKKEGKTLILTTGSDFYPAQKISHYFGFFSDILASDGETNLTGLAKAKQLIKKFGFMQFDYIGNSWQDFPVWKAANKVFVVSKDTALITAIKKNITQNAIVIRPERQGPVPLTFKNS